MTKLELIAASLTQMCNHSGRCHWINDDCPVHNGYCSQVSMSDWIDYMTNGEKTASELVEDKIIQRLDRIESLIRTQIKEADDPKSFSTFLNKELRKIGSGARN